MNAIIVKGYTKGGECLHCGRELKHVICTSVGDFGAACFSNKVTMPRVYQGKKYRLATDSMITLAKEARDPGRNGISLWHLTFEAAEIMAE